MSTRITAVPSSIAKCNEIMTDLFDFKSNLHEEMLLNSTFYSDNDEYSNGDLSNGDDEFRKYSIDDLDSNNEFNDSSSIDDASFNVYRMNDGILNSSIAII